MGRVDVDDVETGALGPLRRVDMPPLQLNDVGSVHRPGLPRVVVSDGPGGDAERGLAGVVVGARRATVPQLDTGQRSVCVDRVDGQRHCPHVVVVPQCSGRIRLVVRRRMDRAVLRVHRAPPAFGLHAAHTSERLRPAVPHAGAMGYLVEAVRRRDGTDTNWFEQDVEAGVAWHVSPSVVGARPTARPDLGGRVSKSARSVLFPERPIPLGDFTRGSSATSSRTAASPGLGPRRPL